ncbi:MAG: hypothetical protein WCQ60_01845 [bacterium]
MKKKYPAVGKLPRAMYGVAFQKKSDWQKDNCINSPSFGGTCRRKSTMEAVNGNSFIRCCSSPACKRFAALLAKTPAALSPKKSREKAFLVGIHPYAFRPGTPAEIIGVYFATPKGHKTRPCYRIRFSDGKKDWVPLSEIHGTIPTHVIISELDVRVGKIPGKRVRYQCR